MFAGLTEEICRIAWAMVLPGIKAGAADGSLNRLAGAVVVLDPASADGAILFTGAVSEEGRERFTEIATAKAELTRRTGLPSGRIQQDAPFLYRAGDVKWIGSTVRDGLVVAFSGVQGEFDEMISEWMASAIRAICRWEMTRPGGAMAQDGGFLQG